MTAAPSPDGGSTAAERLAQAAHLARLAALQRRLQRQPEGPARRLMQQHWLALQQTHVAPAAQAVQPPAPVSSPLQALQDLLGTAAAGSTAPELKAISQHRATWSRLHTEQRLNLALAQVPGQAGPLNTQRLVHQTLAALRELSPPYLHHLLVQVEALLWLEAASQAAGPVERAAPPARKPRP